LTTLLRISNPLASEYKEAITGRFVEPTVNEVITTRTVKKQQIQWSHLEIHYFLQARTATLNDELPYLRSPRAAYKENLTFVVFN